MVDSTERLGGDVSVFQTRGRKEFRRDFQRVIEQAEPRKVEPEMIEREIERLVKMPLLIYERVREEKAKVLGLGIRLSTLGLEVKSIDLNKTTRLATAGHALFGQFVPVTRSTTKDSLPLFQNRFCPTTALNRAIFRQRMGILKVAAI